MATGQDILSQLDRRWATLPAFDPAPRRTASPRTIGELLVHDFEAARLRPGAPLAWHQLDRPRTRESDRPVDLRRLLGRRRAQVESPGDASMWEPFQATARHAVKWLKKSRRVKVDLAEPLAGITMPGELRLMKQLGAELDQAVGEPEAAEMLWGWGMADHVAEWHGGLYLPVWEAEGLGEAAPILDLLDQVHSVARDAARFARKSRGRSITPITLPEHVYQLDAVARRLAVTATGGRIAKGRDPVAQYRGVPLGELERRLGRMVATREGLDTLGPEWPAMVQFLRLYRGTVGVWDYAELEDLCIDTFGGLAGVVDELRWILRMREATGPIVDACSQGGDVFWHDLLDHLVGEEQDRTQASGLRPQEQPGPVLPYLEPEA